MSLALRGGEKRAGIALAIAIGIYLVVAQLAVPAWDAMSEKAGAVSEKEDQLRRYRRALAAKDRYAQLLDQVKKSTTEGEARLIRGDNPSLASVELQTIIEDAAKKLNISLGPRSVTAAKRKDDHFNEITMTLSFEGTPNQMASLLGEFRAAPKFVTVKSLQVTPVSTAQERPAKGEIKKTVRVSMTVAGLLAAPAVVPAAAPKV
jgi:Tfp pilus assembly protein PilO